MAAERRSDMEHQIIKGDIWAVLQLPRQLVETRQSIAFGGDIAFQGVTSDPECTPNLLKHPHLLKDTSIMYLK
jgi:hypothetical protein